jgi:signal transduction histidine kinase
VRVGQRLVLAVTPAVVGLLIIAALAAAGRARAAQDLILWIAVAAAVATTIVAWASTRTVAARIERLAAALASQRRGASLANDGDSLPRADELDMIEARMQGLTTAVAAARDDGTRRERAADERAKEYAALIDDITGAMSVRIEEAQLPLHILLSSPFGALNENQEEMLSAAQSAVDSADVALRRLRKVVELDRGAVTPVIQPIGLGDLMRPALAIAQARAVAASVQLHLDISDRAPRVLADAVLAQEALTTVLGVAIASTPAAGDVAVTAGERDDGRITIEVAHARSTAAESLDVRLARRLLAVQHARLTEEPERTIVEFPAEPLRRTPSGQSLTGQGGQRADRT